MNLETQRLERYREAASLLPERLQWAALSCPAEQRASAEEFRLRTGQPLSLLGPSGETALETDAVSAQDLQGILDRATEFSVYRSADSIRQGYVTVRGGCRVGLCGTSVLRGGEVVTLQELSSLSIRIARELPGIAAELYPRLWEGERFTSTLLVAPPGAGKTTMLRDLIRCLAEGSAEHPPLRVAVADERGEIAAVCKGTPQFQIGSHTDVLSGAPKEAAILMLLRSMNPQVIALDEITAPGDIRSMQLAANCGVAFLATVHGRDVEELRRRRIFRELLDTELFHQFVILERQGRERCCRVERC